MSPPSWTSLPLPTPLHPLGCHRAPGWAPCIIQQIPTGWLFYIGNVYVSLPLWICPTLSIPYCVHKSVLYVFVSIAALQIGSSVPFFNDMISIFTIPLSFQVFFIHYFCPGYLYLELCVCVYLLAFGDSDCCSRERKSQRHLAKLGKIKRWLHFSIHTAMLAEEEKECCGVP